MSKGKLDQSIGNSIIRAADDVINGKLNEQFPLVTQMRLILYTRMLM